MSEYQGRRLAGSTGESDPDNENTPRSDRNAESKYDTGSRSSRSSAGSRERNSASSGRRSRSYDRSSGSSGRSSPSSGRTADSDGRSSRSSESGSEYSERNGQDREDDRAARQRKSQNRQRRIRNSRIAACFFIFYFPFQEVLLRAADADLQFFGMGLWRGLLESAVLGLVIWLIGTVIVKKSVARFVAGALFGIVTLLFCVERCCRAFFGSYYLLGFMTEMTNQVATNFAGTVWEVILRNLWYIILSFIPFVLFIIFRKILLPPKGRRWPVLRIGGQVAGIIVLQLLTVLLCNVGSDTSFFKENFTANSAVPRVGLVNSLRMEIQYSIFGMPEAKLTYEPEPTITVSEEDSGDRTEATPEVTESTYKDNVMDIDFDSLIENDTSDTLLAMDQYFSSQEPTQQNEYTGMFEGKNLIFLVAEGFSGYIIDEELTPAMYQLANTGFVFNNYYQPDWTQSTTGGEFASTTGLIPTWVNSETSMYASVNDDLPFSLGWQLKAKGYTTTAFHNNTYTYYHRDETHPHLGYDYYAIGNGLELESAEKWPASDLEMLEATIPDQIEGYLDTGTPFHTYYMTVSGHANYNWAGQAMCKKNREVVEALGLDNTETVQAYIACQLELEYALEYLIDALEEAGIADDTVIVMTADHYPYAMAEDETDYYNELTGLNDSEMYTTRYINTLMLWSGSIKEPIVVDTPCSAIDILPTVSNLFGLEYDSRLMSGRDILSPDVEVGDVSSAMHVVPFADKGSGYSWVTSAGVYEAYTDTFTPFDEDTIISDSYIDDVTKIVVDRNIYAKYIVTENYYHHVFPDWTEP